MTDILTTIIPAGALNITIIAVAESLCILVLSCHAAPSSSGKLILCVTDNTDVRAWIRRRKARNAAARYLLRLFFFFLVSLSWK